MKRKTVVFCLLGAMALGTCTVSAASGARDIPVTYRNIKIVVDGKELSTSAEPFIYNGTTYLPIRAVGEAVGKEVAWNSGTNTVVLSGAQQTSAPSLPILGEFLGYTQEEVDEIVEMLRSGESATVISDLYCGALYSCLENPERAEAAYEEAQTAFAFAVNNPDYAEAKQFFEEFYQNNVLPRL